MKAVELKMKELMVESTLDAQISINRKQEREIRKLKKSLETLTDSVLYYLDTVDTNILEAKNSPEERFELLARYSEWLELRNDSTRYSVLGVDFRADNKKTRVVELKKAIIEIDGALFFCPS